MLSEYNFQEIPFERIERIGQISQIYRDLFCVSWLLGRFCNYKCSYCWPYARADKKDHRPTELLLKTLAEIKRQARERQFNSFHFSFSGGEPTLHAGYLEILRTYAGDTEQTNYQSVHMTSNLSPGIAWFKKYVEVTSPLHRVSVTASFHSEFAEREKFRDKILFLLENDVQVTINMVMVPERFEKLWELAMWFHDAGINVTLKPQSNPSATAVVAGYAPEQMDRLQLGLPQQDYTRERMIGLNKKSMRPVAKLPFIQAPRAPSLKGAIFQMELTDESGQRWFMDQAERLNAFQFNRFKGWECSAGYRSLIIREPDGLVKRSYSCQDRPLGHIETGFELFKSVRPCETDSCVSSADSKIPKRKMGSEQPLWP